MVFFPRISAATCYVARIFLAVVIACSIIIASASPSFAVGGVVGGMRGTVVDDAKQPVANADVAASSPSGSYHARTDARGNFTIIGVTSDTYTVSVAVPGYSTVTIPGVTVAGDQTVTLNTVTVSHKTIGTVRARSATSAFQVNATTDSTTLSGNRIAQALGSVVNNNEQQLLLAAPGVQLSSSGDVSIRGSLGTELGYQFDGVNFSSPFFDANGSGGQSGGRPGGYLNGIQGGSGGSVQVVSGAGDATQGNIGAGVINLVPARGTSPGNGDLGIGISSPYYNHQFNFDYGIATPSGRLSDYVSVDESRYTPEYAPYGVSASFTTVVPTGGYGGTSFIKHDDVVNNLVYKFGNNNDQSIQFLYRNGEEQQYGNSGGLVNANYYPFNPNFTNNYDGFLQANGILTNNLPAVVQNLPGVPLTNVLPTQPEEVAYTPTYFMKVGYNKSFGASTFLQTDWYNWNQIQGSTANTTGNSNPAFQEVGGKRTGFDVNLTHQFGSKHTVTIASKYENSFPRFTQISPGDGIFALGAFTGYSSNLSSWAVPVNGVCPVTGFGGSVPSTNGAGSSPGCYIYNQLSALGTYNGQAVTIPSFGIDMHHSDFQSWGVGIRDQWSVTNKLKLDYGLREDSASYKFGATPFALNPQVGAQFISDLGPSQLTPQFLTPHVIQPRVSASYELDPNNSVRASYGRSVEFVFAQIAGTPFQIYNLDPRLASIPATDSVANPLCGSGYNNSGTPGYKVNPNVPFANTGAPGYPNGGYYFKCANFAQQTFWAIDQQFDAPDVGGENQPTFSNYDVEYRHQFTKGALAGWGTKVTGYWRRSFNVVENVLLQNGPPNPLTGQSSASIFSTRPDGVEKTFGTELSITTPDVPYGFSGFFTADYLSQFSTVPPATQGTNYSSDAYQPIINASLLQTGTLFRSGYLPPFSVQTGFQYKTRNGFKINPIISANTGYPIGVGNEGITYVNGQLMFVTATNYGSAGPIGGAQGPGHPYNAPNFVDPALPGSYLNPNIAATRGYGEAALTGGHLSNPQGNVDVDLEYQFNKRVTVGAYIGNIFDNHYGTAFYNTKYQAVAKGVNGPQSGQNAANPNPLCAAATSNCFADYQNYQAGGRDGFLLNQSYGAFTVPYNAGTTLQVYLATKL